MNPSSIIKIPPNTSLINFSFYRVVSVNLQIHFITEGETLAGFFCVFVINIRLEIRDHVLSNAVDESPNNTVNIKCFVRSLLYDLSFKEPNRHIIIHINKLFFIIEKFERFIRLDKKKYKHNKKLIYFRILKPEYVYIVYKK